MSEPQPNVGRRQFDIWGWLRAQAALVPLLAVAWGVAFLVADAHYDERYVKKDDGVQLERKVDQVRTDVSDIKTVQAVNAEQIRNINATLQSVQNSQDNIGQKLDRLIERR